MAVLFVGVSHATAPLATIERLAFTPDDAAAALASITPGDRVPALPLRELVVLSTCHRVELYAVAADDNTRPSVALDALARFLVSRVDEGESIDAAAVLREGSLGVGDTGTGIVVVRDLAVTTVCPHHLLPAFGTAIIAYQPGARIAGMPDASGPRNDGQLPASAGRGWSGVRSPAVRSIRRTGTAFASPDASIARMR